MGNVGPEADGFDRDLWQSFDRLPREVRRAIANAPFDYVVTPLLRDLNDLVKMHGRRAAVPLMVLTLRADFAADLAKEALALYGRAHPQALQASRKKARASR